MQGTRRCACWVLCQSVLKKLTTGLLLLNCQLLVGVSGRVSAAWSRVTHCVTADVKSIKLYSHWPAEETRSLRMTETAVPSGASDVNELYQLDRPNHTNGHRPHGMSACFNVIDVAAVPDGTQHTEPCTSYPHIIPIL